MREHAEIECAAVDLVFVRPRQMRRLSPRAPRRRDRGPCPSSCDVPTKAIRARWTASRSIATECLAAPRRSVHRTEFATRMRSFASHFGSRHREDFVHREQVIRRLRSTISLRGENQRSLVVSRSVGGGSRSVRLRCRCRSCGTPRSLMLQGIPRARVHRAVR